MIERPGMTHKVLSLKKKTRYKLGNVGRGCGARGRRATRGKSV